MLPRLRSVGLSDGCGSLDSGRRRVLLVGAGIVNLITAWELVRAGYKVRIIDAGPDPRTHAPWQLLGATHGGGNARMFSLTEADNYNGKGGAIYSGIESVLLCRIREGGWLAREPEELTEAEQMWIARQRALPAWLAEVFTRDIYSVNRTSMLLWARMQAEFPFLFGDIGLVHDLLRLYSQADAYEETIHLQGNIGAIKRILTEKEVAARHPSFARACAEGRIIGGLEVVGFTVNIHDFVARLLSGLESQNVFVQWGLGMSRIEKTRDGLVAGLRTARGIDWADHYVVSPGACRQESLVGTRTYGKVQGIFGLWLTLPNLDPMLTHSVKLHREGHVGEDSNLTLAKDREGRPILLLGSGYGFLGTGAFRIDSPDAVALVRALEETAQRFLPDAYHKALSDGSLRSSQKGCVRPFTATGLGIFEVMGTLGGGRLVITTGHNTGGFAQAPAVAAAVLATLNGALHSMQEKYDPERGYLTNRDLP